MRAVLQRVRHARVEVADRVVGSIGPGLLVLVGVERGDGPDDVAHIAGKIRDLRNQNQIKPRDPLAVFVQTSPSAQALFVQAGLREMVMKLAVLSEFAETSEEPANAKSFVSGTEKYFVPIDKEIDVAAECAKIKQELEHQRGFVRSVEAKLSNERFVGSAPAQVVENERKKMADGMARIAILEESAAKLGCS